MKLIILIIILLISNTRSCPNISEEKKVKNMNLCYLTAVQGIEYCKAIKNRCCCFKNKFKKQLDTNTEDICKDNLICKKVDPNEYGDFKILEKKNETFIKTKCRDNPHCSKWLDDTKAIYNKKYEELTDDQKLKHNNFKKIKTRIEEKFFPIADKNQKELEDLALIYYGSDRQLSQSMNWLKKCEIDANDFDITKLKVENFMLKYIGSYMERVKDIPIKIQNSEQQLYRATTLPSNIKVGEYIKILSYMSTSFDFYQLLEKIFLLF